MTDEELNEYDAMDVSKLSNTELVLQLRAMGYWDLIFENAEKSHITLKFITEMMNRLTTKKKD